MRSAWFSLLVRVFAGVVTLSASAFALTYVVKKGDTLSTIASQTTQGRVYGKKGGLRKLLGLNPQVKNQDLIFPGDKITLSPEDTALAATSSESVEDACTSCAATREPASSTSENQNANFTTEEKRGNSGPEENSPTSQNRVTEEADLGYGLFSLTPEFVATKLSGKDLSTGATASLVSKSNYGMQASYSQVWTKRFQTDFYFGLSKLSIKEPSSGGTLQNADQTLHRFGLMTHFGLTPRFTLSTGFGLSQRPILKAISSSVVSVDSLYVPSFVVQGGYDFFSVKPFTMGATLGAILDLPSSESGYKTKLNYGFDAALYVKHEISKTFNTEVGLKGSELKENTSIAEQTQTDFSIYLKLKYLFGGGVEK